MTSSSLLTDAQRCVESRSPAGLTVARFEIVDDVAEVTLAFTPEALERVVREQLRTTGVPPDWAEPGSSMAPGSPSWAYALELAELFNDHYLKDVVLERHLESLEWVLAVHGHDGTPVVARPAYSPSCLAVVLRRLRTVHRQGLWESPPPTHAA